MPSETFALEAMNNSRFGECLRDTGRIKICSEYRALPTNDWGLGLAFSAGVELLSKACKRFTVQDTHVRVKP